MNQSFLPDPKNDERFNQFETNRLFKIIDTILDNSYPNIAFFENLFGVSRRTIQDDIHYLRKKMGFPIFYHRYRKGYYFDDYVTLMPPKRLYEADLLTLLLLRKHLMAYRSTGVGQEILRVFDSILGPIPTTKRWKELDAVVVYREEAEPIAPEEEFITLKAILSAIRNKKTLSILYHDPEIKPDYRDIEPHLLAMRRGRWHLYAFDCFTRKMRTFAIGKILGVMQTQKEFRFTLPVHPESLLDHSFGSVVKDGMPEEVVINFSPRVAELIRQNVWHPKQTLEPLEDGGMRFSLKLNSFSEIIPWILSWGADATVIAPAKLIKEVSETLEQALMPYAKHQRKQHS